ncbi:MAG: peptidase U62 [Firmicutes bacterium]|nr:peptidase U62 [Bacillota bacterium]
MGAQQMVTERYFKKKQTITLQIQQTALVSVRRRELSQTGIRVYANGRIGVAGALGACDEGELAARARENLSLNIPYPYELSSGSMELDSRRGEMIPEEDLVAEIEEFLSDLRREQPGFLFFNQIKEEWSETRLANDKGLDLRSQNEYISLALFFKEKDSLNIFDGMVGYSGKRYDRAEVMNLVNRVCAAYKNPVALKKPGIRPVVFLESHAPVSNIIHELNGLSFGAKSSLLAKKRGKKVFSSKFSLAQSLHPDDTAGPFFDAEGVVNEGYRYPLIKDGVVLCPYTDKKTAAKYNLPLTGSAVAEYDGVPGLGRYGFKIGSSGRTVKELLGGEEGILIVMTGGAGSTPTGYFSLPVQLAFAFDGEELTGRLPQLKVSGNLFTMFGKGYRGVSTDKPTPLGGDHFFVVDLKVEKL